MHSQNIQSESGPESKSRSRCSLIPPSSKECEHQANRGQPADADSAAKILSWDRQDWGGQKERVMNFTSIHTHGQHVYEGTKHGERGNAHSTLGERLLISVEVVNLRRASCRMGDDSVEARSLDGGIDREVYTHTQIRYD